MWAGMETTSEAKDSPGADIISLRESHSNKKLLKQIFDDPELCQTILGIPHTFAGGSSGTEAASSTADRNKNVICLSIGEV